MNIRDIEKQDLPELARLYAAVFNASPWCEPWTEAAALKRLAHFYESKGFIGLLAEENKLIKAMLMGTLEPYITNNLFYLREICVAVNEQNQGIGKSLLSALNTKLSAHGVIGQYVATDKNLPAASFYASNGYVSNNEMVFMSRK